MINHLGTIINPSTKSFLRSTGSDRLKDSHGPNPVGWCWFLLCARLSVADKVTVRISAAGEKPENGVFWESAVKVGLPPCRHHQEDRGTGKSPCICVEARRKFLDDWRCVHHPANTPTILRCCRVRSKNAKRLAETVILWGEENQQSKALWNS